MNVHGRPAVFFDRDNTLILNDGYLGDPAGVILTAGAADAVARAHEMGYAVVIVSNQSGVARGLFTEEDVEAVNARMEELLLKDDGRAVIDRQEFCPFHPEAVVERYRRESELRKPRPGMILRAAGALNLDLGRSWLVGDAGRDIEAGKGAGCRTILLRLAGVRVSPAASLGASTPPAAVGTGAPAVFSIPPAVVDSAIVADATVASLAEAMDVIARAKKSPAI